MKSIKLSLAAVLFCLAGMAFAEVKAVYQISESLEQASHGLRNIRNHLLVDPTVKIVVVAHGMGVDFLLKGAEDKNGNPYSVIVEDLVDQGVEFRVCNLTLKGRGIDAAKLVPEARIVPAGSAEVVKLQALEHYAYFRP